MASIYIICLQKIYRLCLVDCYCVLFFFVKQKTAYELRISDWSSDVCSSDLLVAQMGRHNAIVASQTTLAKAAHCSLPTLKRALSILREQGWIEVRQIGPTGTACAYVINDRVAWTGKRDGIRYSLFSAAVLIADDEQPDREELGAQPALHRLPNLFPGERQLPSGPGLPPPSEPSLPGMEPDLPATQQPEPDPAMQEELSQLVTGLGN